MKDNYSFGRVGVLMGGLSLEREVSLDTGDAVYRALVNKKIDAIKIDWNDKINIVKTLLECELDIVFIALHGGGGEDGNIQAILNNLNIPYTGSGVKSSAMMMDKVVTKRLLISNGLDTPSFVLMPEGYNQSLVIKELGLPLVVKPIADGSSRGVTIVHTEDELESSWFTAYKCGSGVFAEKMIRGLEVSVSILGDRTLPSINIISSHEFYDYSSKYISHDSKYIVPAVESSILENSIQSQCLEAYQLGNCRGWGRVDGILDDHKRLHIIDINTIPGLTSTSLIPRAASKVGLDFDSVIIKILSTARID